MPERMKAIVKIGPHPGLELVSVDIPSLRHDETLIKVTAVSICGTDLHIYSWNPWAQERIKRLPLIIGHEFAGKVVEVGPGVSGFSVGDYVSADSHMVCGECLQCRIGQQHVCSNLKILGVDRDGCFAEYVAIPARVLWKNDEGMPPELASVQDPLGNALYCTLVEPVVGKSVLVIGDGPIGLFSVGIARASGASWIGLIGHHPSRMEVAKKMGADATYYGDENENPPISPFFKGGLFSLRSMQALPSPPLEKGGKGGFERISDANLTSVIMKLTGGIGVDIVLEMSGSAKGLEQGLRLLRKGGRFSAFGLFPTPQSIDITNQIIFKGITLYGINGRILFDTWYRMHNLLKSRRLDISHVITHKLAFDDFETGFALLVERPKKAVKVVLMMES